MKMRSLRFTTLASATAAVAILSTPAPAVSVELAPTASEFTATLEGEVSVQELAAKEANRQTLQSQQKVPSVEQPVHRLPDGSLTSEPSKETLDALPLTAEPNADTKAAAPSREP
jgi:hypothetical protein